MLTDISMVNWYLYQIHILNDILNDEEMIISHLMVMCELHHKKYFYDKNNIKLFEKKNSYRKSLAKRVPRKKPFRHSKIWDTKRFKRIRKIQELPTFGKFVTEVLIFVSVEFSFYRWQLHQFSFRTPSSKTGVKPVLSPELLFFITYTSRSNWYPLISVS